MKEATIFDVLVAGGGGGITYWAYTLLRGGQPAGELAQFPPGTWMWVSLILTVVLGAAAAFLMVYFVAATNTKQRMKAIGFAVACGLCWEPVLAGISTRFTQQYGDRDATKKVAEAQQLRANPQTSTTADMAADVAVGLVKSAPTVQNPILKTQVDQQTDHLFQTIEQTANPVERANAFQKIGLAAAEAHEPAALAQSVKSLEVIADTQPQHAQLARHALKLIDERVAAAHVGK